MAELLEDRTAVVTGASRGIGRCIARTLADEGMNVALAARTEEDLQKVKKTIEEESPASGDAPRALVAPTDLTDEGSVKDLVSRIEEVYGGLDVVVNNAGVATKKPLAETTTEEWDRTMAVNARGPFLMCRECLPLLRESDRPFIINVASVVAIKAYYNQGAYTASKHALRGMTRVLAQEYEEEGIRVHEISPGGVATEMVLQTRPDLDESVLMKPQDIADIAVFLLTREGNAVIDEVRVRRAASDPWF